MADTAAVSTKFPDIARVDARAKVTGAPVYGSDHMPEGCLHASFTVAPIVKGRVESIDTSAARAVPGVRLVATHEDMKGLNQVGFLMAGGHAVQSFQPMLSDEIAYRGQPIAMVVAETLEGAVHAASLITATYAAEGFSPTIDSEGTHSVRQADTPLDHYYGDAKAGDAPSAYAAAATTLDLTYRSAPQHQNPMELIATVAEWDGDTLTIHESTQSVGAVRDGVAEFLGIDPANVVVVSPQVGGGFGQKNSLQSQTGPVAWAARELGAPVKMVVPRAQLFHGASFRPASVHRIRLGADADGRLTSVLYDVDAQTSRFDLFPLNHTNEAARLYGIPNFQGAQRIIQTDSQTPGYMRGPFEHLSSFALDSAVDEMAARLGRDPVEYRLAHDTSTDPVTGLPFSSRHLAECLRRGAEMFGWERRTPEPRSMTAPDGSLIGLGVGCGCQTVSTAASIATLRLTDQGRATISIGVHEMGQGVRTALANAVAGKLGLPVADVEVELGDTRGMPPHVTAGSWGTTSAVPAAEAAADRLLAELGGGDPVAALRDGGRAVHEVRVEHLAPGQPPGMLDALRGGHIAIFGPVYDGFVTYSYAAHFVEVRVEPTTRRIRVPRVVSVIDCGRVASPRTAESQVKGGVVWGLGAALREASEVDPRYGGFLNADIAEYLVPVNADIGDIEVAFINRPDPKLNAAGVKSLGEVVMTGVAAAIANAVWHATGTRLHDLPIRLEHLL